MPANEVWDPKDPILDREATADGEAVFLVRCSAAFTRRTGQRVKLAGWVWEIVGWEPRPVFAADNGEIIALRVVRQCDASHYFLMARSAGYREFVEAYGLEGDTDPDPLYLVRAFADWMVPRMSPEIADWSRDQFQSEWERWND